MSLSQPKVSNPCKKFLEFKAGMDAGVFQYWDKTLEKNISLPYPVAFIVLDELNTIAGFNDSTQSGVYSNEVRSLQSHVLNVRTFKGGLKIEGLYADIKSQITDMGGKFCRSVYIALVLPGEKLELANLQLKGASFKSWVDCTVDKQSFAIEVQDCIDAKKGKVHYKVPVFKQKSVSKALLDEAVKMDELLQVYLKTYMRNNFIEKSESHVPTEKPKENDEAEQADMPF